MDNNQMGMETSAQQQTPPKKSKVGFIILGIILAVLLLGVGGFFAWRSIENSNIESGEAVIMAFMKDYDRLRLEDAYELFHPDVREEVIENQLDNYSVSDLEELEDFLDMYYGGLELEYEINKSKRLSKEELEDVLSDVYHAYRVRLDISKAYAYQVTETFSGENGTLKIIEQYVVGKEDGEWYIIAVSTEKVVKDNVTFTFPEEDDEPIDIIDAWMEEFEQLNAETSFQLWHPAVRELAIEEILTEYSSLDEYAESMHEYYGDLSIEYEILESSSLSEKEQEDLIARLEEYYGVQLQFDFSNAWVFDIQESYSSDQADWVVIETYYLGKEDGQWYILDVRVKEMVSIDEKDPDPVIWGDDSEGFDSGEEALDQFISEYLIDLKESYNAAHPLLRDTYLQLTLDLFNASSVEEYNTKMASAFGDATLTYEINEQYLATDEELEIYLSHINESYGVQLDLSECILYSVTLEIQEPGYDTVDFTEEIVVGKDGDKWYVIEGLIGYY